MAILISSLVLTGIILWPNIEKKYRTDENESVILDPHINILTDDPVVGRYVEFNITGIPKSANITWFFSDEELLFHGREIMIKFHRPGTFNIVTEIHFKNLVIVRNLTIKVRDLLPPIPSFQLNSLFMDIYNGDIVLLNASNSFDTDGQITSYEWMIGNDSFQGQLVEYTFNNPGTFQVGLIITDNDNLSSESKSNITVRNIEDIFKDHLVLKVKTEKPSFYIDEELILNVTLENTGDRPLSINPLTTSNIHFNFTTDYFNRVGWYNHFELGSQKGNMIGNVTWDSPITKVTIDPFTNLCYEFNLRKLTIFMGELGKGEEWRNMDWFIDTYMDIYWIDASFYINLSYIPSNNFYKPLVTRVFEVHVEWRPIYQYIIDRNYKDEKDLMILSFVEDYNYGMLSGKELWFYQWGAKNPSYINRTSIQNFSEKFYAQKNYSDFKTNIFFNYTASVNKLNNYSYNPDTGRILFYYGNGSILPEKYHGLYVRDPEWEYRSFKILNATDTNITSCFAVNMWLFFELSFGSLGAELWYVYQLVVLTEDLEILYVLSEPAHGVA